jgi:predicted ester cyclase
MKIMNQTELEKNKAVINRFDQACIEHNDEQVLNELVADDIKNHAAPKGAPNGKESFRHFLNLLHTGLSDIKLEVLRQIADNDLVVTQKIISGLHTGNFMGIPKTNKTFSFEAIEIIRLENGKYVEHWVQSDLSEKLRSIGAQ